MSWNREISRIFHERCVSCHRSGGSSFSLETYKDARPRFREIKAEVLARRMPPWGAVKGFGDFRNDQALTAEQLEMVVDWVENGLREGDPRDLTAASKKISPPSPAGPSTNALRAGSDYRLREAFRLDGLMPERVPDGVPLKITAELPNGKVEPLLWLYEYKKEYGHPFLLRRPLDLPARTVIRGIPRNASVLLLPVSQQQP